MRWVRVNLLAGLALLVLPSVAAAATADASAVSRDFSERAGFRVKASNGYSLSVTGDRETVTLSLGKGSQGAIYEVPGRVSTRGVWADLGDLGHIAVRFRPDGNLTRRMPPRRCEGRPRVTKRGSFVGTILFRGEYGFTRVDETRARGHTHTVRHWTCKPRRRGGGRGNSNCEESRESTEETIVLDATSERLGRSFAAVASIPGEDADPENPFTSGPGTSFSASSFEQRGGIEVIRIAFVSARMSSFAYDANLSGATVSPPPPFSGSAAFKRFANRNTTWRGDLRVTLPGAPSLPLTGKSFEAGLKQPLTEHVTVICTGSSAEVHFDLLKRLNASGFSGR